MLGKESGIRLAIAGLAMLVLAGASPAPTSSVGVERRIEAIRKAWASPGAVAQPNSEGWNAYFDAVNQELATYRTAESHADRSNALARLQRLWQGLGASAWGPAFEVRSELEEWLRPRIALSWADKSLSDGIASLPEGSSARAAWTTFHEQLRDALRTFEGAGAIADQSNALRRVSAGLNSLRQNLATRPWGPGFELEAALTGLIDRPNLDATIDVGTLSPLLNNDPVQAEVIQFKGQTTYVTPGPRVGFGLLASDAGIAFVNSQYSYSVTPVQGFADQISAGDPRGERLAKIYTPSATAYNTTLVNAVVTVTPDGAFISPDNRPNVTPAICIDPVPGKGLQRAIASLIGFNQDRILSELQQKAGPQLQQQTAQGAAELGAIKAGERQAQLNADLRRYLVGNRTLDLGGLAVSQLGLSSQPSYARINGLVDWNRDAVRYGSPNPKPASLRTISGGVAVDVHLVSVLGNLVAGFLQGDRARSIENIMVQLAPNAAGAPSGAPSMTTTENVDYPTYLAAVRAAREQGNGASALRLFKPAKPPEFAADSEGRLVVVLRDWTLEVPAPPNAQRGGGLLGAPADVYRLMLPTAELPVHFELTADPNTGGARLTGKIGEFTFDPESRVEGLGDDESKAQSLNLITRSTVLGGLAGQIANRPIDAPIQISRLQGLSFHKASPLDPTGWMRVVLLPNGLPLSLSVTSTAPPGTIGD